ncbi:MAG: DNA-processing protein DprA [Dongiaceae bacterium]
MPTVTDAERLARLRLIRSENVGPVTFRSLLQRFGSAGAALRALPDLARRAGRTAPLRICPAAQAEEELNAAGRVGARLLASDDPGYPAPLAAIYDAPPLLYVRGDAALLGRKAVAIVGARNASANGRRLAEDIARDLGGAGFAVVSGLARGIDHAAHRGSLESGTIAAVAGGADVAYPPDNEKLQHAIAEHGAVVTEMPPGTVPTAKHFPRRNRLISGLSLGVLVVEAALQSGSLITARLALEQGREVLAVPGSPLDPRCRGTNNLIRQGATLVEGAADVTAALAGMTRLPERTPRPESQLSEIIEDSPSDNAHGTVVELLGPHPVAVDELVRQCHLSAPAVRAVLLDLELAGRLERHPGNRVSLLLTATAHGS